MKMVSNKLWDRIIFCLLCNWIYVFFLSMWVHFLRCLCFQKKYIRKLSFLYTLCKELYFFTPYNCKSLWDGFFFHTWKVLHRCSISLSLKLCYLCFVLVFAICVCACVWNVIFRYMCNYEFILFPEIEDCGRAHGFSTDGHRLGPRSGRPFPADWIDVRRNLTSWDRSHGTPAPSLCGNTEKLSGVNLGTRSQNSLEWYSQRRRKLVSR